MIKLFSLLFVIGFTFTQCEEPESDLVDSCPGAETYILDNLQGLDGCSWVLVRGDNAYEPINLAEFVTDPVQDETVMLKLEIREDFASICLVGTIVEITCQQ